MSKRNGFILGLLFLVLVVEILILAPKPAGLSDEESTLAQRPSSDSGAQHSMQGVSSIGSRGEQKEWELSAVRALRMTENEDWILEKVRVKFFGERGVTYTVTGQKGQVDVKKNNVRISGQVVTRSSNGYTFRTEAIDYDSSGRRLSTTHPVALTGPLEENGTRLQVTGSDLVADMNNNQITVGRDVRARKAIRDGKIAQITSDRAILSGKTNSAQFLGKVVIDVDTVRITGPEAKFVYKDDGHTIESMTVEGGVKVTDVDKWATSQRVSVHFEEDRFVFNGGPRVVQSGDELFGEQIEFLKGGREVRVSNARAKIESSTAEKAAR